MADAPWTPLALVKTTAAYLAEKGVDAPRLDAERLLAHVLGCARIGLYTQFERPLVREEVDAYRELVRRRAAREPVSRIVGAREFMGIAFRVTPAVFSPRPETEGLVEEAVRLLRERGTHAADGDAPEPPRVLDLCTGSGCVAVSVAAHVPAARVVATEISPEAAAVARGNAESAGVAGRVEVREGDLLVPVAPEERFDLVLANPPYLVEGDPAIWPEVRDYDPALALYGGADGLELVRRIAAEAAGHLAPGGAVLVEVGAGQAAPAERILAEGIGRPCRTLPDAAGIPRVVVCGGGEAEASSARADSAERTNAGSDARDPS
jgi:release factor glutamine methyltransferase